MASKSRYFWLLQFHPKADMSKLKEKRLMMSVAVRYEKPTNKLLIMQCSKCNYFEHAKSSCFNDFRCIKCPDKHERGNCEKYDHPANSPTCPVYLKLLNRRKINNNTQNQLQNKVVTDSDGFTVVGKNGGRCH